MTNELGNLYVPELDQDDIYPATPREIAIYVALLVASLLSIALMVTGASVWLDYAQQHWREPLQHWLQSLLNTTH